jgi:hypothetical protein
MLEKPFWMHGMPNSRLERVVKLENGKVEDVVSEVEPYLRFLRGSTECESVITGEEGGA